MCCPINYRKRKKTLEPDWPGYVRLSSICTLNSAFFPSSSCLLFTIPEKVTLLTTQGREFIIRQNQLGTMRLRRRKNHTAFTFYLGRLLHVVFIRKVTNTDGLVVSSSHSSPPKAFWQLYRKTMRLANRRHSEGRLGGDATGPHLLKVPTSSSGRSHFIRLLNEYCPFALTAASLHKHPFLESPTPNGSLQILSPT